jgi:sec-independent protein translocase protein TatB
MLPSLGFQEIVLLAILALIVVGPKDLPLMLRKLGRWTAKLRAMAQEFRTGFDELARQAELDELKKEVESLRRDRTLSDIEREITRPTLVSDPEPPPALAPPATVEAAPETPDAEPSKAAGGAA